MNAFLKHLRGKFLITVLDPLNVFLALPLCLGMFIGYWIELPMDLRASDWFGTMRWVMVAVMAAVLMGGRTATEKHVMMKQVPMPNLPIKPMIRVAADVAFLCLILLAARVLHLRFFGSLSLMIVMGDTVIGLFALIPIFFVFTPRRRSGNAYHILDSLVVVLGTGLLVQVGAYTTLLYIIPASILLIVLAVGANQIECSLMKTFKPPTYYSGMMYRSATDPTKQFQRDLWLGAIKRNWLGILGVLFFEVLGIVVFIGFNMPHIGLIVWTGTAYYFLFFLVMSPGGTGYLSTEAGQKSTFYSDFDGSFLEAWSILPIHPRQIVRGVYSYITTVSIFFWLATLLTFIVSGWSYTFYFWIPFLVAIPSLAGLITTSATGDKPRTIFLSILFCFQLIIGMGIVDSPGEPGVLGVLVFIVFLLAGIIPVLPVLRGIQAAPKTGM